MSSKFYYGSYAENVPGVLYPFIECGGEDTTAGMPQMMVSSPIVKVMNTEAFNSKWYNRYNTPL
ncbi:MAG: hypothetical protein ICV51_07290 [Flavisolibacter sp.]|nr:hypothetical protein [Flavisolibacter sp.]